MSQVSTPEPAPSIEVAHYLRVLKRRAWVVLLGAVLGLAVAVGYLALVDRTVTATTSVNVNVISSDPFNPARPPAELIDAETEAQTATSSAVMQEAAATLDGATPSELREDTEAALIPEATIMRVSHSAGSTQAAEEGADAIAQAYLDYRSLQAADRVETIVDKLNERRDALREDLVRINSIVDAASPRSPRALQAESDRQLVNIELDSLSTQINSFLGLDTTGGRILSQASENPTTVAPSRAIILAAGLLGGALLGLVAAFVLAATDRRVRDEHDVRRLGGGEVVGELASPRPTIPADEADMNALRAVRERLLATLPDDPPTVTVVDLTVGGRAPAVAVNLAEAFTETGRHVDLVLADADESTVTGVASSAGLERASGGASGGSPRYGRRGSGLSMTVARPGTLPTAAGVSANGRPDGERHDRVTVVAVPPGAPEAVLLSAGRAGGSVLLVVTRSRTRRATLLRVTRELVAVGARLHGTVVGPKRRRRRSR